MPDLPREMWQSLMINAPNIILVADREGVIQYINRTVPGLTVEEVIGKSQYEYIDPEYRDLVRKTIEGVFETGRPASYEVRGVGADGGTAWYASSVGPILRGKEVVAVSIFTSDDSERKRAEEELRRAKDELLAQQSRAILELSTPVIQIWDEILVLPLIGTVDTLRAQQILNNLLEAIAKTRAEVAIIDITGVPVVDTKVAHHFLRTIDSAKMLGTETILTGVSSHNAQTLVKLGVDLTRITTKASLQAGLRLAFDLTRNTVSKDG